MKAVNQNIISAADMVNLVRYPIADLETVEGNAFAQRCRKQYLETGLCMLTNFIVSNSLQILADEARYSSYLSPQAP